MMETIYDWVSMAIFGGLVVLFLHRSTTDEATKDTTLHYLPPAIGCAVANYVGNKGEGAASALIVIGVILYVILVLKPFGLDLQLRRR
jgi:hypothetical protein